uniref:Uncharacterized protein n=1 Tax=Anguilla anguilla TaxID=7936 RepID=A0A0E9WX59_ANGAN
MKNWNSKLYPNIDLPDVFEYLTSLVQNHHHHHHHNHNHIIILLKMILLFICFFLIVVIGDIWDRNEIKSWNKNEKDRRGCHKRLPDNCLNTVNVERYRTKYNFMVVMGKLKLSETMTLLKQLCWLKCRCHEAFNTCFSSDICWLINMPLLFTAVINCNE